MSLQKQRIGQIGINTVEAVVLKEWGSRWQQLDSINDDGIDGLIFIERGDEATGQIVFAQVKCMQRCDQSDTAYIAISEQRYKLQKHISRWRRVIGAAILICVCIETGKSYWVNLLDEKIYTDTQIKVDKDNIFNKAAKNKISELCGTIYRDIRLKEIITKREDFTYLRITGHMMSNARQFYKELSRKNLKLKSGESVKFNRDGWRHITRRSRPSLTQMQSLLLLGTIEKILSQTATEDIKPFHKDGLKTISAVVQFPFRQAGVVKIVVKFLNNTTYSFYSIYEPRRNRNHLGIKN